MYLLLTDQVFSLIYIIAIAAYKDVLHGWFPSVRRFKADPV